MALTQARGLAEISFAGNPICDDRFYSQRTIVRLPQIQILDGLQVSAEDKVKAQTLQ